MNAPRLLPVVAILIAAGSAAAANGSPDSAGTDPAVNLVPQNNLRGGSRHLQGADEIAPLLTVSGGLSKCQGDCDSDEDCAAGLVCWYDWDGSGKVPGCAGTPQPDSEYCIDPNDMNTCVPPGDICELGATSDPASICCSPDNACVDSRCVTTDPPTDTPTGMPTDMPTGTTTGMPTGIPTMMPTSAPAANTSEIVEEDSTMPGNYSDSSLTERPLLNVCEGDCDYDEDCADGLVCWYDDGSGRVPGCTGTPRGGWEYCIEPIATDSIEADSDTANQSNYTGPSLMEADLIKKCEGDCDWDEDCADGLVCWYDDDETGNIPGCTGTPRDGWEYCIDPDMIFTNATHVEWLDDFADDLGPGEYGRCQGDCDEDIDCEGELVCFYPTEEIRIVPGCKGPPTPDWEYCTDPKAIEEHTKRFGSVSLNSTDDSQ